MIHESAPERFFIPHLIDDPAAAEAEWQRYLKETPAPASSRRVYSVTYRHNGDRYVVTVGKARRCFPRKRGPRGGYIKDAGYEPMAAYTGTVVSGIVDDTARNLMYVWSYGPPFGGWANPSLVGHGEVDTVVYFDGESEPPEVGA